MKKKNVNKLLALGLVSAMTAGMLAGCGNTASTTTDKGAADTTVTEATDDKTSTDTAKADNGEVPTLIWWSIGGTPPDDFDKTIAEISDYTEEKIGVRIDVKIASWADWATKMNNIVNTGEYFDLMFVNNTNYTKFVNLNALADITELVQSETPELYDFIPEDLWRGATIKEKVYAVPTYKDSSLTQFWMLDDSIVQKYDIDMESIKDFATLDPIIHTIKEGEGKSVYPIHLSQGATFNGFFNGYDGLTAGVAVMGVKYDDESRKVVNLLEQDGRYAPVLTITEEESQNSDMPRVEPAERAQRANDAGAVLLFSIHGNSDPSGTASGFECYAIPPGQQYHDESVALARLTAQKITQTGQPLRGQDGVRYIYFDTYDNRMVYESSDETPRNEPTFRLLADADCPAVLVEQCFLTNPQDAARLATPSGAKQAAKAYYEAICEWMEGR